ncbi:carbohydrate kinase family protein [Actinoplanes sp. NPDC051851]|uniref:carbohydrate kinase family protein n=1 Tax=Actinoplanes sp. NPDC051851 TaxID=3154753 RepID=UPI00342328F2
MSSPVIVTGSIATDHLMTFAGSFADSLLADKLAAVSLSFLVEDLQVRRGGVAANICYGIARLGGRPVLVGAVGPDFTTGYRPSLERHGVDCSQVWVSETAQTARFICTTDEKLCQIASFYPGAMTEAGRIDLEQVVAAVGDPGLVVIAPDTPEAMLRHADACRRRGWTFGADPSQQLARMTGSQVRAFVAGAAYLFSNEYEHQLLLSKTGWTSAELQQQVGVIVTTLGPAGVRVVQDGEAVHVPAVPVAHVADPTGSGDAFRAGFVSATAAGASATRAAERGSAVAALALAAPGSQEYDPSAFRVATATRI